MDWVKIFDDLKQAGRNPKQIAQIIGVPPSSLDRWRYGDAEPKYSIGEALLLLHTRYCGESLTIERQLEAVDLVQLRPKQSG